MYPGCETEVLQFALLSGLGWENPSELVSHPCPDGDSGNGLVCPESVSSVFTSMKNKVAHDFRDTFGLPELSSELSCAGNILEDVIHHGEIWLVSCLRQQLKLVLLETCCRTTSCWWMCPRAPLLAVVQNPRLVELIFYQVLVCLYALDQGLACLEIIRAICSLEGLGKM